MDPLRLSIPLKLPSANTWSNQKWGWAKVHAIQKRFIKNLPPLVKSKRAKKGEKRKVSICRILGPRERRYDPDNIITACKPLVDALKKHGYIYDDNEAHMDLAVTQDERVRPAKSKILISIRDLL